MANKYFTQLLMHWHFNQNNRQMPWKGEKNPYKVWLSEVILQQTRVEQGWEYFERFIKQYTDIQLLANAKDDEVFKLWEGLGYYNRCKNLLATARKITSEYNGVFPQDYDTILSLKGIGQYTAAAISSFCFGLPYPVIDGNVLRVLSRVFAIKTPVDGKNAKQTFTTLAEKLIYKQDPGAFNQAIMDFGATICKPALPLCNTCPLQEICKAYNTGKVNMLPVKEKILKRKTRWFTYFIFKHNNATLVHKRTGKDIWQNLFEFYLVETAVDPKWDEKKIYDWLGGQLSITNSPAIQIFTTGEQQLTHQQIKGYFIQVQLKSVPATLNATGLQWLQPGEAALLPFPRFINQYMHKNARQPELFNC
jgi:A/G-specific adenine glycosylase